MKRLFFLFLILIVLVTACAGKPAEETPDLVSTSVQQTLDWATPIATEVPIVTPSPAPSPSPTPRQVPENRTHYRLQVLLNYYSGVADVSETITYTNRSTQAMDAILLAIPPRNFAESYRQKMLTGPGVRSFVEDGATTLVSLNSPLQPGEQTQILLEFRLVLPQKLGTYGVAHRQTNLVNWYPYVPPYDEQKGWTVHPRIEIAGNEIGEYVVNELSDFDVSIRLTDRAELIEIAASAPAEGEPKSGNYHYKLEKARSFSISACDSYFEQEIMHNGVRLRTYLFFNQVEEAPRILEIAAKALDLYGELWMPYPREMLSIVAADFLHNMEMDGMVMISYGVIDNAKQDRQSMLDYLVPHEVSHQWFYSLVHNDQAAEPWLDESLATYSESIFYEHYYPDLSAWWWTNRVDKNAIYGSVNAPVAGFNGYDTYRNAVYLRGAQFLRALRTQVGDEAFFKSLKDYFESNLYGIATAERFMSSFRANTDQDINAVISQFFDGVP